jgi:putative sugar O-methyltransferase
MTTAVKPEIGIDAWHRTVRERWEDSDFHRGYPLTDLWAKQNLAVVLPIILNEMLTPAQKIAAVQCTFLFSVNTADEAIKSRQLEWYRRYFRSIGVPIDSLDFEESEFSNFQNSAVVEGKRVSGDFLRTVLLTREILLHCALGLKRSVIVELGSGYGGLARTLKLALPNSCYVLIDIPDSLYFAAHFLKLNFPNAKHRLIVEPNELVQSKIDESCDFIYLTPDCSAQLLGSSADLFVNTASLGEMTNATVRHWMDFIERGISCRYAFLLNRFLNTIRLPWHRHRLDQNTASVALGPGWDILKWEVEAPFTRNPYLEGEVTRNLEIIAKRKEPAPVSQNFVAAGKILGDLVRQDWWIHRDTDNTMRLRDCPLAPDLTMTGALFMLWTAIRLSPTAESLDMMVRYLKSLERGKPFEERFFYEAQLAKFTGKPAHYEWNFWRESWGMAAGAGRLLGRWMIWFAAIIGLLLVIKWLR